MDRRKILRPAWHFTTFTLCHCLFTFTLCSPLGSGKIPERRSHSLSTSGKPVTLIVFSADTEAGASQLSVVSKGTAFLLNSRLDVGEESTELMLPADSLEKPRITPHPSVSAMVLGSTRDVEKHSRHQPCSHPHQIAPNPSSRFTCPDIMASHPNLLNDGVSLVRVWGGWCILPNNSQMLGSLLTSLRSDGRRERGLPSPATWL